MSLVIFCLLFSFVDYVQVKGEILSLLMSSKSATDNPNYDYVGNFSTLHWLLNGKYILLSSKVNCTVTN